jgi:hypothetical protein
MQKTDFSVFSEKSVFCIIGDPVQLTDEGFVMMQQFKITAFIGPIFKGAVGAADWGICAHCTHKTVN